MPVLFPDLTLNPCNDCTKKGLVKGFDGRFDTWYIGQWKNEKFHGHGTLMRLSEVFEGSFDHWSSEICDGFFKDGKFDKKNGRCIRGWFDDKAQAAEWNDKGFIRKRLYICNEIKEANFSAWKPKQCEEMQTMSL